MATPSWSPAPLPSQCARYGGALEAAVQNYDTANAACVNSAVACLQAAVNASCPTSTCTAGEEVFADNCLNQGGSFCIAKASAPDGIAAGGVSAFTLRTALCLPPGCNEEDLPSVATHYLDTTCGSRAQAGHCTYEIDCDFNLSVGDTLGIVFAVLGCLALVFLACYCYRRYSKRVPEAGGTAVDLDALMETQGGTYALLDEREAPAAAPPAAPPAPAPAPIVPTSAAIRSPATYSRGAAVGNDALLESQAGGL